MKRDKGKSVGYGCYRWTDKRKAYRQCRKNFERYWVAFDDSETWSLDYSFLKFCLDQGVFKKSKQHCHSYLHSGLYPTITETDKLDKLDILDDINSYKNKELLISWLVPRLDRFCKLTPGYPGDMTYDSWKSYIQETIEEVRAGRFDMFIEKICNFWW